MNKFTERYNLPPIHPHKFRHSQASILIAMGSDIITVAERLGHKDRSTTLDKYGHLLNNQDRKASNTIANTLYRDKTPEDSV
ncbi:MAG: tyrosine-type recombinase/integrase [Lachnospiraceae bacterium]|nr:tyrosine-type recombinase/integrase [Lachnospiraceae bacterium]